MAADASGYQGPGFLVGSVDEKGLAPRRYDVSQYKTYKRIDLPHEHVGEGNWLTGEFVAAGLEDGTVKSYYENQQKVFIDAGRITEEVPVEDYVMFDVMEEAVAANYGA